MKHCTNCGNKLEKDNGYCSKCGEKINSKLNMNLELSKLVFVGIIIITLLITIVCAYNFTIPKLVSEQIFVMDLTNNQIDNPINFAETCRAGFDEKYLNNDNVNSPIYCFPIRVFIPATAAVQNSPSQLRCSCLIYSSYVRLKTWKK